MLSLVATLTQPFSHPSFDAQQLDLHPDRNSFGTRIFLENVICWVCLTVLSYQLRSAQGWTGSPRCSLVLLLQPLEIHLKQNHSILFRTSRWARRIQLMLSLRWLRSSCTGSLYRTNGWSYRSHSAVRTRGSNGIEMPRNASKSMVNSAFIDAKVPSGFRNVYPSVKLRFVSRLAYFFCAEGQEHSD